MKPTAQIILYTTRIKQNGKYPVKLRIIYQRDHKDFKMGIDLSQQEFDDAMKPSPPKAMRVISAKLISQKDKANKILDTLNPFTFTKFENEFNGNLKDSSDIFPLFLEYIDILKSEDRHKTAIAYNTALNSIKSFHTKAKLNFYDINPSFLKKYQNWMLDGGKGRTTVGIYVRALRAIYNYGISKGILKNDENYPFGKNKFIIPAGRNIKKALTMAEIKKIHDFDCIPGSFRDRAKDFWLFSYFCNGINFKDIAYLKRKNIDGDMLRFIREKTKRTSQGNQIAISCFINDKMKLIIDKWGNQDKSDEAYIFPIISESDSTEGSLKKIEQFIQNTNKNMKRICDSVGLEKKVTTYHGRHSAATILKRSGASLEQIQEALGHSTSSVTQKYLDSFEDDTKKELSNALQNFI